MARIKTDDQGAPDRIWLQLHGDADPKIEGPADCTTDGVTWCWEKIHDADVEYIRRSRLAVKDTHYQDAAIMMLRRFQNKIASDIDECMDEEEEQIWLDIDVICKGLKNET